MFRLPSLIFTVGIYYMLDKYPKTVEKLAYAKSTASHGIKSLIHVFSPRSPDIYTGRQPLLSNRLAA